MKVIQRITRFCVVGVAAASLFAASSAMAQSGGVLNPNAGPSSGPADRPAEDAAPQPTMNRQYPVWVGYVVMLLMVSGVMGVSLIPSKRSHQD